MKHRLRYLLPPRPSRPAAAIIVLLITLGLQQAALTYGGDWAVLLCGGAIGTGFMLWQRLAGRRPAKLWALYDLETDLNGYAYGTPSHCRLVTAPTEDEARVEMLKREPDNNRWASPEFTSCIELTPETVGGVVFNLR